jgi:hypothetical protein
LVCYSHTSRRSSSSGGGGWFVCCHGWWFSAADVVERELSVQQLGHGWGMAVSWLHLLQILEVLSLTI